MARARRTAGWLGLCAALGAAIWGIYAFLQRLAETGPEFAANRLLLTFLTIAIIVLALGLAGVLIRNLVRLITERKQGILGSRLRAKLVFFFLVLVLLPALLLTAGSVTLIKSTLDAILRAPFRDVTESAQQIVDSWTHLQEARCRREASLLAQEIVKRGLLSGPDDEIERLLDRWRREQDLQAAMLLRPGRPNVLAFAPDLAGSGADAPALEDLAEQLGRRARRAIGAVSTVGEVRGVPFLHASAVVRTEEARTDSAGAPVVTVGMLLGPELRNNMQRIASAADYYRERRAERRQTVRLYYSLIAVICLATVFVATWMGFYLSRRITEPVEELAAATREISTGNLDVRVRAQTGDEVGMLVAAFNEMAGQLQESREVISRSTAELRRSYQALDERRRYVETLLANLSTAILSTDPGGVVTTANPAVERVLGIRPEPGEVARDRMSAADLGPLVELLDEAAASGEDTRRDLSLRRNGQTISVSVRVSPLRGAKGESLATLVMVEDLTDLLRAQKTAAWQEVARRIAHEIKNPLTPIQLSTQRLRKKFFEGAPDLEQVVSDATAAIEREVAALKRLVDEFSRFARMPEVNVEPVAFDKVVDSVLALYQGHAGIRWEIDAEPGLGEVRVDPEQMRRALINLIDNAIAAMGGQGTIRIATRAHAGPGSLRLEVADTGPGIPPADRARLFEPSFSTKRRGTGLGLAIVHRVVTEHHGTIRVEDNVPMGARFVIEIPA
jgi:two-component system nitrogen regulation sensor histidine kinase NtrY